MIRVNRLLNNKPGAQLRPFTGDEIDIGTLFARGSFRKIGGASLKQLALIIVLIFGLAIFEDQAFPAECMLMEYPTMTEWTADDYTLPNSLCIFPDGRTSLNDAVFGNLDFTFLYLMDWDWTCNCMVFIDYPERGLYLGAFEAPLTVCGQPEPYIFAQNSPPCSMGAIPIFGGGHSEIDENGNPISSAVVHWGPGDCGAHPIELYINSPDINGDQSVDLGDVGAFVIDYFGGYNFRSDFFYDGVINLADVGIMGAALGARCN